MTMDIGQLTLSFPGISAEALEEKLQGAIKKFNLKAAYHEEQVIIIGPREALEQISVAYQMRKMMSHGPGVYVDW
jgi:hypothetical protein